MDFFEQQSRAHRKTKWLVGYFLLAVLGIIAVLQVVFALLLGYSPLDPSLLAMVALGVGAAVTLGSVVKTAELSQGGRVVATMLGGQPVPQNTTDLAERRLLNVVEEMAIASGVPVPEIYILPDTTINAFAAGHAPGDAAIGVTRGCIDLLNRDELQGVIGHEFSHILNGDMRLNIRLIGVLNGILFLAILGGIAMRTAAWMPVSGGSSSREKRDGGNLTLVILLAGVALYLAGYIGVFFGKLIKAAVSRQREFLADASAVQFTRNPGGLAGALWKIQSHHSLIQNPRAEEASHLFFGNGLADPWMALFATHPPVDQRIQAIAPNFQPDETPAAPPEIPPAPPSKRSASPLRVGIPPDAAGLAQAASLLSGLPEFSRTAAHELHDSCALIYSLLLSDEAKERQTQLAQLSGDASLRAETQKFFARRGEIDGHQRIGLVDLAIPTLRHLSAAQYAEFRDNVQRLVASDGQVHLFEYVLQKILVRHLDVFFTRSTGPAVKFSSLLPLLPDVGVLLSALAVVGHPDGHGRDEAFAAGVRELTVKSSSFPLSCDTQTNLPKFDAALDRVASASPEVKRTILQACAQTVMDDGVMDPLQGELLRAIADTLDCPMPPFVRPAA